ncbi:hypothetical protein [Actinoplanes sp. N902-109]|uniref:hypothetical protein n=1 Tax=Actinoplanes sp. (strain N902-109) TaxID=649831 RepID=UPI00032940CB|nr:hypothetical protein [Actinoplanes sp. N902-109]AGL15567.1 hypothetical protein L083_2057 [Actinoplanes sp. N902-109]
MNRRLLLGAAGWLGAAVLAVLVGMTAINVIGAGLTSRQNRPLSAAEVDELLRRLPSPAPSAPATPAPSASAAVGDAPVGRTFTTRAGTVVARCRTGVAEIVSMSPRQGWSVHEQRRTEGEFRSSTDNHNRVELAVSCAGAQPRLAVENRD